jgi:hypothetical protein
MEVAMPLWYGFYSGAEESERECVWPGENAVIADAVAFD